MKRLIELALAIAFVATFAGAAQASHDRDPDFGRSATARKGAYAVFAARPGTPTRVGNTPAQTTVTPRRTPFTGVLCRGSLATGRTCTYFRADKPYRVCVAKRGKRTSCRGLRFALEKGRSDIRAWQGGSGQQRFFHSSGLSSSTFTPNSSTALNNHGLTNPLIPAVGRIFRNGIGHCSGTLVRRGVVLTAAHCIYEQGVGYDTVPFSFVPGNTFNADFGDISASQYGEFYVCRWGATQGYASGDDGMDWAFLELCPDSSGRYPGDYGTGWFDIYANIRYGYGAPIYMAGYPASGNFEFFHNGNGQYFCDATWGDTETSRWLTWGSNYYLAFPCPMSGGSSGGGFFVRLSNGAWVLGGVHNHGYPNARLPSYSGVGYFDQRIIDFFYSMFPGA